MRVIAIDPAPSKPSTVFDGRFRRLAVNELAHLLRSVASDHATLVCWDAPLTGPRDPAVPGAWPQDYSQRLIEQFFSRYATGFKTPAGISVRPYSGCPHWALSRALIGLPRVGPWDLPEAELPFRPLLEGKQPPNPGAYVVEVHPAVALWLWCSPLRPAEASWDYKKDSGVFSELRDMLLHLTRLPDISPQDDDELDALVAYVLGIKWLSQDGSVVLLGNRSSGSFLVPNNGTISEAFAAFMAQQVI